ncbi:hypothetical protein Bca101_093424 [Brassica carinata]
MCLNLNNEEEHASQNPPRLHHRENAGETKRRFTGTGTTMRLLHRLIFFPRRVSIERVEISSGKNEATKHLIHLPCLTPSIGEHPSTSVEISSNTLEFLEAEGIQKPNHYKEPASFIFKEKATEL